MKNVSASYISSLSSQLDASARTFMERWIEQPMKFICIDATHLKIMDAGKYGNKSL
ncbi:transposase [Oxyplasma meridianum]|uniref:Transposase n=1 Tax=Oxyplasma meridianum TaxID=3073602 RepID=A0AAX4NEJ7_9ARCH